MAYSKQMLKQLVGRMRSTAIEGVEREALAAVDFFKAVIELERMKTSDALDGNYFDYDQVEHYDDYTLLVDVVCNQLFNWKFRENLDSTQTKFPKDLCAGICVYVGDKMYRLLSTVIDYDDYKDIDIDSELLPLKYGYLEVDSDEAERLNLTSEEIDAINDGIAADPSRQGVEAVLKQYVAPDASLGEGVFLTLTSKSALLSQIYAELNSARLAEALKTNSLFLDFLTGTAIDNEMASVAEEELIQITALDEHQLSAVASAINSRVSVITGPPGTGKTQVIENILANALLQGKRVLVASKNNKAVDNVKDRFDAIDPSGYLLRFGSKSVIAQQTSTEIRRIQTEITSNQFDASAFSAAKRQYDDDVAKIRAAKRILCRADALQRSLVALTDDLAHHTAALAQIESNLKASLTQIDAQFSDVTSLAGLSLEQLHQHLSALRKLINYITAQLTGTFGFWHNWFSKKKYAAQLLAVVEDMPYQVKEIVQQRGLADSVAQLCDFSAMQAYEQAVEDILTRAVSYIKNCDTARQNASRAKADAEAAINRLTTDCETRQRELDRLQAVDVPQARCDITACRTRIVDHSSELLSLFIEFQKHKPEAKSIISKYLEYIPNNIPWRSGEYQLFTNHAARFFDIFRLSAVTSLSARNAFPLASEFFDMVIIDEASQCDIASALPLMMRTKQLVVIGDPMQLRHITPVKVEEETEIKQALKLRNTPHLKYVEASLWDYCRTFIGSATRGLAAPVVLRNHYRCHPQIIGYSNRMFYRRQLGGELEVKTDLTRLKGPSCGIVVVDVQGTQKAPDININEAEARKAVEIAVSLAEEDSKITIGIVTPFRHQAEYIHSLIPAKLVARINADTVHRYQGDEKDAMIYTTVVTDNSPGGKIRWIDRNVPNLVNVAVTRARSVLYVVCNKHYIMSHSSASLPLGQLIRYQ